jgi:parallel beta-helix repeat protein
VVTLSNIQPRGVRIVGFTIRNGSASDGAGLKLTNAAPTLVNCVITENIATGSGGGIACSSSSPLLQNCTIVANSASQGGGVFISGVGAGGSFAQFDLCVISANDAAGAGGGLYNSGLLLVTGSTLEFNQAGAPGGALFTVSGATSAVGDSYFCLNAPNNVGGAPFTDLTGNVLGEDCNSNGICDLDEIAGGAEDKNQNNQLDDCELARGDLNLDGVINAADLSVLLNFWGAVNPPAGDLNRDGVVSAADLSIMLNNWRNN